MMEGKFIHDSPRRINNTGQIISLNLSNSSYSFSPGGGNQQHRKSSSSFKTAGSNTTSLTSEMSISPSDEDCINSKPKFMLSPPSAAGRFVTTITTAMTEEEDNMVNDNEEDDNEDDDDDEVSDASSRHIIDNDDSDGGSSSMDEDEVGYNDSNYDTGDSEYHEDKGEKMHHAAKTETSDNEEGNHESSSAHEENSSSEALSLSSSDYNDDSDMARMDSGSTSSGSIPPDWGESGGEGSSHAYLSSIGIGNPEKMRMIQENNHNNFDAPAPAAPPSTKNNNKSSRSIDSHIRPRSQTSLFGASYGSLSLGGDTSLSSMDTFRNSPVRRPIVRKTYTSEPPKLDAAQPAKSILREKTQPIIPTRRRYYSSDDDDDQSEPNLSDNSHQSDSDNESNVSSEISTSDVPLSDMSLSVGAYGVSISSSSYGSSFLATSSSDGSRGGAFRNGNASGSDTGDVSIPTMSTDEEPLEDSDEEYISESEIVHNDHNEAINDKEYEEYNHDALQEQTQVQLPSHPPLLEDSTSSSMFSSSSSQQQQYQQNSKESLLSDENTLGFAGESWTTPVSKGTTSSERALESQSDGSWSLSANWAAPKDAGGHWASRGEIHGIPEDSSENNNNYQSPTKDTKKDKSKKIKNKKKKGGSRRSLSSKGSSCRASSKSTRNKSNITLNNRSSEQIQDTPRSVEPFPTMATKQPQSAYDKNAPWYCGDDDDEFGGLGGDNDDDLDSDSSSVLSAFKKKEKADNKSKTKSNFNNYDEEPAKEMSMSFSALLGGGSSKMSTHKKQEQPPAGLEGSMSLADLNSTNNGGEKSMSFTNLQQSGVGSGLQSNNDGFQSSPLQLLPEESLHSASLDDFFAERDKEEVPLQAHDGLAGTSSPQAADESSDDVNGGEGGGTAATNRSSKNRGMEEEGEDKDVDNTRGKSIRQLQRIFAIGFVLFLLFDLVLLTLFLVRRGKDNTSTDVDTRTSSTVLATVPETLCWDWVPGQGKSLLCSTDDTASGGGAVANVVAEAIRVQSPEPVDFALIPAGLANADIPKGNFTYADAGNVIKGPLSVKRHLRRGLEPEADESDGSSLVILEGTGTKIVEVLELSLEDSLSNGETHSYPYGSGLRYSVNRDAAQEERVISPVVLNEDNVWGPLNSDRVYKVITTKEWADSYFSLQGKAVSSTTALFALADYAQNVKTLREPVYSTREFVTTALETQEPIEPNNDDSPVVEGEICLSWLPGDDISNLCTSEQTATRGGGVGNLVAWGVLTKLKDFDEETDIFLLKASDCQLDLATGRFDEQVATALIPGNDNIVLLTLNGYQVVQALENSVQYALSGGTTANYGSYPYAGGLRFKVDAKKTLGNRVTDIEWFNRGEWKALSLEVNNYRISTTFTLAEGEYGYSVLFGALSRTDTDYMLRDLFFEYANDVGTLRNPPESQFSTQQYS